MGNQTTKTYGQVSTIDDTNPSDDDTFNNDSESGGGGGNLTFVFHTTEDDCSDRVVHDNHSNEIINDQYEISTNLSGYTYTIIQEDRRIAHRTVEHLHDQRSTERVLSSLNPGDSVELISDEDRTWVLYTGESSCLHLRHGKVVKGEISQLVTNGVKTVNHVYSGMKSLGVDEILQNAEQQINCTNWSNSECFVMWCRTGSEQFMTTEYSAPPVANYKLVLKQGEDEEMIKAFASLPQLIEFRRKLEVRLLQNAIKYDED